MWAAHRLEEERVLDQTAATAREETMLKLVSQSMTKSTSRLVESAVKEQIKAQIVPAIGKVVTGAVQEEVAKNVKEAVKQVRRHSPTCLEDRRLIRFLL